MYTIFVKYFYFIYNNILNFIIHLLFPNKCIICSNKSYFFNQKSICYICERNLKKPKDFIITDLPSWIYYKYSYKDKNVKKIEYSIKYFHNRDLCRVLGKYVYDFVYISILQKFEVLEQDYIIIPVPISKQRYKERGYNQAREIAIGLDKNKIFDLVVRDKNTQKLFGLDQDQRSQILKDVFKVDQNILDLLHKKFIDVDKLNVLIIDDITTTGATFYNIRNLLVESGFKQENIFAFALAH
jgi:competence protein ComFC